MRRAAAVALTAIGLTAPVCLPKGSDTLAYQLVPGEAAVYKLQYTSSSVSDLGALFGGQGAAGKDAPAPGLSTSFDTRVTGELSATVIDIQDSQIFVAYRIRNAAVGFKVSGLEASSEAERIRSDIGRNVFARVTREGRVLGVRFDPREGLLPQSFARALIAITQFVLPTANAEAGSRWEVEEDDPNGTYLARYELIEPSNRDEDGARVDIRKTKIKYVKGLSEPTADEHEIPTRIIPASSMAGMFGRTGGYLLSLSGPESQTVQIADKNVSHTDITLQLQFLRKEKISEAALAALKHASASRATVSEEIPLSWREPEKVSETAMQRKILGGATLDDLLGELRRAEASGVKQPGDTRLFLKIRALVYLEPPVSQRLARVMEEASPNSLTVRVLTGALSDTGSAEAQAALSAVIRKRSRDADAMGLLLPALAIVTSPTEVAEETLRNLAFSSPDSGIAYEAQLALGTMSRTLLRKSRQRADKIVDRFISQFEGQPSPERARQLLLVLGNTGSPRALPVIRRYLIDPSSQLRIAAVGALRFVKGEEADALLTKALLEDAEPVVRLQTADSLGLREMTAETYAAQKQDFARDDSDNVRLALLQNLWYAREKFPEVLELLKTAAAQDRSDDVRKKAAWMITSER